MNHLPGKLPSCPIKDLETIIKCHQEVQAVFPGLILRWAKIFGSRWSYVYGNNHEPSYNPQRLQLSSDYGVFIDNPELLCPDELKKLLNLLQEYFSYAES